MSCSSHCHVLTATPQATTLYTAVRTTLFCYAILSTYIIVDEVVAALSPGYVPYNYERAIDIIVVSGAVLCAGPLLERTCHRGTSASETTSAVLETQAEMLEIVRASLITVLPLW